ncbi:hypothetical protein F4808DRAFT_465287 [Astrocystis sublimbata]|nr:hypothetical protein F4808DRAFT_465287 [Astrocystis sublimbata]
MSLSLSDLAMLAELEGISNDWEDAYSKMINTVLGAVKDLVAKKDELLPRETEIRNSIPEVLAAQPVRPGQPPFIVFIPSVIGTTTGDKSAALHLKDEPATDSEAEPFVPEGLRGLYEHSKTHLPVLKPPTVSSLSGNEADNGDNSGRIGERTDGAPVPEPQLLQFNINGTATTASSSRNQASSAEQHRSEGIVISDQAAMRSRKAGLLPRPKVTKFTHKPNIDLEEVKRERLWVFECKVGVGRTNPKPQFYYLALKCPTGCRSPMLSKHPLYQDRAEKHFRKCGVDFVDEYDMLRKYARIVVSRQRITRDQLKAWNSSLLKPHEAHLESENLA